MYLKSVILDGFKSYNVRTELESFDQNFNAITGLNGSGKSNILDAICFLLGITNLSHVRASNLQDLIYKNGQAGITKASVTVVFDNCDKNQSPIGYEDFNEITICRQVVLGGRNKYLINGCNCTNSRIQDFFCSVQLNVNNPHFLIMQGKITKVLNMKPPETLSMLEEAAGTKMYETKRQVALKTLSKKDTRLAEIDHLINDDINPTIEKLQKERANYLEYQTITRELEHTEKQLIVLEYVRIKKNQTIEHEKFDTINIQLKDFSVKQTEYKHQLEQIEQKITLLQQELDQKGGGRIKHLENDAIALSKEESILSTELEHNKQLYQSIKQHLQQLKQNAIENERTYKENKQKLIEYDNQITKLKNEKSDSQEKYNQCQDEMQSLKAGMDADNRTNMIDDKIRENKNQLLSLDVDINQSNNIIKQLESQAISIKKSLVTLEKNNQSDVEMEKRIDVQVENLKNSIREVDYDPDEIKIKKERRDQLEIELDAYKTQLDEFETENSHMIFNYNLPKNMRSSVESKIKGTMASLFTIKDQATFLTAIEAAASSKLVNVVVDDDETVKSLLKHGNLKKRTTFIVLNRMQAKDIASEMITKISAIEKLHGKVHTAASLIDYDNSIIPAINYVFGATLICTSPKDAKLIVHKLGIHVRCVTLEGDIYEPSGTLTGGSRRKDNSIIDKQLILNDLTYKYDNCLEEVTTLDEYFRIKSHSQKEYDILHNKLELKVHELSIVKKKLESSPYFQTKIRLEELNSQINSNRNIISEKLNQINTLNSQNNELEIARQNAKNNNATATLESLEIKINDLKNHISDTSKQIIMHEEACHGMTLEIESFDIDHPKILLEIDECVQKYDSIKHTITLQSEQLSTKQKSLKELEEQVSSIKEELNACDHLLGSEIKLKTKINNQLFDVALKLKETNLIKDKLEKTVSDSTSRLEQLERKHDWIRLEKKHFNVSGSSYDFRNTDENTLHRHFKELQSKSKVMSKHINVRAMEHLAQAEERYNELLRKKKIVEDDKQKICQIICDLDEKKKETLVSAWQKVNLVCADFIGGKRSPNRDFASIFSTLLPGATVKLVPVDRECPLSGLEIAVGFGSVWKENLAELSGGQRSLVALSLILSLLLFNPAPIYILDEVDAALDISHTQNIGVMLRKHFKKSQFIVVSLKEGMFNNANVLFKTRFVDGSSTVTRHSQRQSENPSSVKRSHPDSFSVSANKMQRVVV